MSKQVLARDTISGKVGMVPEIYLSLPGFADHLVAVDEGAKDFVPGMFKPEQVKERETRRRGGSKLNEPKAKEGELVETEPTSEPELQ